ncbi:phage holin family protein [Methylobacillus gramineus]|uniref:phage holin family protein n=1 Tax=Methylobacillus gramineus TaxID=755169 RepID=UPI001CFF9500|nr:phage holin family protein [Methylobacillus gramineus]MCB5184430.1 phage holin family protein [Methylobacillus gramineus]
MITGDIYDFILHWAIMSVSLWLTSLLFSGIKFSSRLSLLFSALALGFVNAIIRPLLLILTFPLTLVTFGFFALVINALMIMLVAKLIKGFELSGFWTAFFASIVIAIIGFLIEWMLPSQGIALEFFPLNNNPNTISI